MSGLLAIIFLFCAIFTLLGIVILIFTHLYQILKEPAIQKQMRRLRKPVQPWVTVLLYSHDNDNFIDASLKALLRSRYHNFDIVVVKDRSKNSAQSLMKGYRKSMKGAVVVTLQAGVVVEPSFLKRAVALIGNRKRFTIRHSEQLKVISLTDILYSLSSLVWQHNYKVAVSDAKNITAIKKIFNTDYLFVILLLTVLLASQIIGEPIIIWYSWLIVTGYLLATIWLNEAGIKTKVKLTFSALSAFFVLPVATVILKISQRFASILRI